MKKIGLLLLYMLVFSIPLGTRTLLLKGVNEYQSFFLYASDVLLGLVFLLWCFTFGQEGFKNVRKFFSGVLVPGLLLGWFILSSIFSQDVLLGFYRTIKLAEFVWFFFLIVWMREQKHEYLFAVIIASGIFQSILAIGQFVTQHDLGLGFLGENVLGSNIAGVAKIEVFGEKFIRAYGTFPHPNILGAFLLFCLASLTGRGFVRSHKTSTFLTLASIPFLTLGLLLTFSRAVLLVGIFTLAFFIFFRSYGGKSMPFMWIFIGSLVIFSIILLPYLQARLALNLDEQALALRVLYTKNAFEIIFENPLFGVGPGQFTLAQENLMPPAFLSSWANQPAHNIYLLLASEAGLPALLFFLWLSVTVIGRFFLRGKLLSNASFGVPLLIAFLLIGFFDHFFLTFQQGSLLFWLTLGLAGAKVTR